MDASNDIVMMKGGRMYELIDHDLVLMENDVITTDGSLVRNDGTIIEPDGSMSRLLEGEALIADLVTTRLAELQKL